MSRLVLSRKPGQMVHIDDMVLTYRGLDDQKRARFKVVRDNYCRAFTMPLGNPEPLDSEISIEYVSQNRPGQISLLIDAPPHIRILRDEIKERYSTV